MQAYGAAKERLFGWPGLDAAIINIDDAFGRALALRIGGAAASARHSRESGNPSASAGFVGGMESKMDSRFRGNDDGEDPRGSNVAPTLIKYGVDREDADVVASAIETTTQGLRFHLKTRWGEGDISTRLLGRFNVSNLLAVVACLGCLGFAFDAIQAALAKLDPVVGRMNRIGGEALPLVVVDYAHTPDALEQALTSLRAHVRGKLICVFGCGGERDAGKRPEMGRIAEALADAVIVTDDNPRGENGDAIVAAIVAGLAEPGRATIERDRRKAISLAIGAARAGDIVLIAGKGHEPYQEIAGVRHPFDDLAVARDALGARA
jgi:UDP-N-acetylmuramoyl-L-alanyl-D-glutamate--2,6-diaminopimelate ligase